MPKFIIDEDMPRSTGKVLNDLGYEIKDVRDYGLRGAEDDAIFQFAQKHQSVLITGDMGFSNILHFPIGSHFGILIGHFPNEMTTGEVNHQIVEGIRGFAEGDFKGNLIIVEPGKVRIRRSP
jgi:predicted nuclease of predicted toxin-antitoxin system